MTEEEKENTEAVAEEKGEAPVQGPQQEAETGPKGSDGSAESESPAGSGGGDNDGGSGEKRIVTVEGEKKVITPVGEVRNWESERQYFRVFFPDAETPVLTVDGIDYEVVDASEKGIKFKKPEGDCPFEADQPVSCKFTLKTGESCLVAGKVLRVLPSMVVLILTDGISFRLLMSEQRRFISIYKHIYQE